MNIEHFKDKAFLANQEYEYIKNLQEMKVYFQDRYIIVLALLNWKLEPLELTTRHRKYLITMYQENEIVTSSNDICGVYYGNFEDQHVITSLDDFELFLKNKCKV